MSNVTSFFRTFIRNHGFSAELLRATWWQGNLLSVTPGVSC